MNQYIPAEFQNGSSAGLTDMQMPRHLSRCPHCNRGVMARICPLPEYRVFMVELVLHGRMIRTNTNEREVTHAVMTEWRNPLSGLDPQDMPARRYWSYVISQTLHQYLNEMVEHCPQKPTLLRTVRLMTSAGELRPGQRVSIDQSGRAAGMVTREDLDAELLRLRTEVARLKAVQKADELNQLNTPPPPLPRSDRPSARRIFPDNAQP